MTALLAAMKLILEVNTSSTLLSKELGQLEDSAETTVTGIGVGNDGSQVFYPGCLGLLFGVSWHRSSPSAFGRGAAGP